MERRYSLVKALRLALILAVIGGACFLYSCKTGGQKGGEASPHQAPSESVEETERILTPKTPDTPTPSATKETTPTPEPSESPETPETPEESDPDETPEASETPEPSEPSAPPETWNTPNKPKNGEMPDIPETLPGIPPDREYPEPDKIAYITIDDGPTRTITPQMLDILGEYGVKATFFVLPHSNVEDLYQRILDEGHVLGNHSYSHKYKPLYAADTTFFTEDLLSMHAFIYDLLGYTPTLYRFPGGAMGRNKDTIAARIAILEEHGYTYFDWNSSTGDSDSSGEGKKVQVLIDNVLTKTNGRKQLIVLMHDSLGKQPTADALPYIIDGLKLQGYAFDTLDNYG